LLRYASPIYYPKEKRKKTEKKRKKKAIATGGVAKKTRRNGINDSLVRLPCVYAVVPCFF
jgi:hypothetical protein